MGLKNVNIGFGGLKKSRNNTAGRLEAPRKRNKLIIGPTDFLSLMTTGQTNRNFIGLPVSMVVCT